MSCEEADNTLRVITRAEAMKLGLRAYFTGNPCPKGHICNRSIPNGRCAECKRVADRIRHRKNPDKILERRRLWRIKNAERIKEYNRKWFAENQDRCREVSEKWRSENPNYAKEYVRRWRAKFPERKSAQSHNRIAKVRGAGGKHTAAEIEKLLVRQKFKCAECRTSIGTGYHKDHIMPLTLGGSNGIRNIQLLCPACNLSKGAKHPIEWAQRNGRLL